MTTKICEKLYAETFRISVQGNLDADWLTDSTNFRVYIGTFNEGEGDITYKCAGDSVYVTQLVPLGKSSNTNLVTTSYSINELCKKQNLNTK